MNAFRSAPIATAAAAAALLALAFAAAAPAAAASADDVERSRIAEERAAIESRYAAQERECRGRFVVTSCIDDAKAERRRGVDALRARQLQLDEAHRRERTAERRAELAAKAADDARREQDRAARAASAPAPREAPRPLEPRHEGAPARAAARGGVDRPTTIGAGLSAKSRGESAAQRQEREARSRAGYETRQRQAEAHRAAVAEKAAQRLNKRPPAAPLPVPASVPAR
ncbi:MAG TPA: hypothetical protein VGO85_15870 [Caldimonas sp.]|jgi:hypothetical protein|nr:hypothetical protein [Caldimonas sp.]